MQVFALVCFLGLLFMSGSHIIRLYHIHFSKEERKNRKKEKRKPFNRRVRGGVKVFAIFFDTLKIDSHYIKKYCKTHRA